VLGISAATILGNGKVAPILDIEALYRISQRNLHKSSPSSNSNNDVGNDRDLVPSLASELTGSVASNKDINLQSPG
jgi:chemotaxis protein histidine kinase CheA